MAGHFTRKHWKEWEECLHDTKRLLADAHTSQRWIDQLEQLSLTDPLSVDGICAFVNGKTKDGQTGERKRAAVLSALWPLSVVKDTLRTTATRWQDMSPSTFPILAEKKGLSTFAKTQEAPSTLFVWVRETEYFVPLPHPPSGSCGQNCSVRSFGIQMVFHSGSTVHEKQRGAGHSLCLSQSHDSTEGRREGEGMYKEISGGRGKKKHRSSKHYCDGSIRYTMTGANDDDEPSYVTWTATSTTTIWFHGQWKARWLH